MFVKPGDSVRFACFYQSSSTGLGVSGLTVYVSVNRGTTNAVTVASNTAASALDATNMPGWYYYDYTVPDGYYGILTAYFTTTDTSVSQRGAASFYVSAQWVVYAAQQYRDANTVTIATNAVTAAALASDAATEIAAGISVPSAATIADAVLDEALSGHATSGTVGAALTAIKTKTDNLPNDPADQSALEASIAGISTTGTINIRQSIPDIPQVNSYTVKSVYGDSYLYADGRSIGWEFTLAQCPLLASTDVVRLKVVDLSTGTTYFNITGTGVVDTRRVYFEPSGTNTAIGDNEQDYSINFEVSITRQGGSVITPIPATKGVWVVQRKVT